MKYTHRMWPWMGIVCLAGWLGACSGDGGSGTEDVTLEDSLDAESDVTAPDVEQDGLLPDTAHDLLTDQEEEATPPDLTPDIAPVTPFEEGQILVTEFMAQSQGGIDNGEWLELYNSAAVPLTLDGCFLYDDGTDTHKISGAVRLNPGKYVVLAKSANAIDNHGLTADYIYSNFTMDNMGDQIVLECSGVVQDRVNFTPMWVVLGRSTQLSLDKFDHALNDSYDNWCDGKKIYGTKAKLGTPGAENHTCDAPQSCSPNPCLTAPAPACETDGVTLKVYTAPGTCTEEDPGFSCQYPFSTVNCSNQQKVCMNGACVHPINPCLPNPCTLAPENFCGVDGKTLKTYQNPGICTVQSGAPVCDYNEQVTDCSLTGKECRDKACKVVGEGVLPTVKGQILITEFMARAQSGTDPAEWVELYNSTSGKLDLGGCALKDNGSDNHIIQGPLVVSAHSYILLARSGDPVQNFGLTPDYVYLTQHGSFSLGNTGDDIVLRCSNLDIDRVIYDGSWVILGTAFQLDPGAMNADANDLKANWCPATKTYGTAGKLGTPGSANDPCPVVVNPCQPNLCTDPPASGCSTDGMKIVTYPATGNCTPSGETFTCAYPPTEGTNCSLTNQVCLNGACVSPAQHPAPAAGQVIVTEFMAASQTGSGDQGEWVELHNRTDAPVDLFGCHLRDNATADAHILVSLPIPANGYVVLAKSADPLASHGLTPDLAVGNKLALNNDGDSIILNCGTPEYNVDTVLYAGSWVTVGVSTQLAPDKYDPAANDGASAWCPGTVEYGTTGKLGTPGAVNVACPPPPDPCVPNLCTEPGANYCHADGITLMVKPNPGLCSPDGASFSCTYEPSVIDCSQDGKVCKAGACVDPTDPCVPNLCTNPGEDYCHTDGTTLFTFPVPGLCFPENGSFGCTYVPNTVDCSLDGKVCVDGACVEQNQAAMPSAAGQLIVTEFMARAQTGTGDPGEYVEFYNTTEQPLDLSGCQLKDDGTNSHTITGALIAPPNSYILLAVSGDPQLNYGLTPTYAYGTVGQFVLSNTGDIIILECDGIQIDRVAYETAQVSLGASLQLDPDSMDYESNDNMANWCLSTDVYWTDGDAVQKLGTPGTENRDCPTE